jgi:hypothetical protein
MTDENKKQEELTDDKTEESDGKVHEAFPVVTTSRNSVIAPVVPNSTFGEYVRKSRICPICLRRDHMEINYMRAEHHMSYDAIIHDKSVTRDALDIHFRKHFLIAKHHQDIIDLQENSSQESNEIISRILEGDVDLFGGAVGILKSKGQRLHGIRERLKQLEDQQEIENLEVEGKQEYLFLQKLANDVENSMFKVQQLLDKKYFPTNDEELKRKMISFKYSVLKNFVDTVILVLIEFEKIPEYTELVRQIRLSLSPRISALENRIMRSGGTIDSIAETAEDD